MQREQGEVTAVPGMVGGMCATWGLVGVLRGAITPFVNYSLINSLGSL